MFAAYKSQRIVVAGFYRSGSTWLYNALRLLHEPEVYACFETDYTMGSGKNTHVVKAHRWLPHLALGSRVVTTWRPIDEVRASMDRMRALEPGSFATEDFDLSVDHFLRWQMHAELTVEYDEIIRTPEPVVGVLRAVFDGISPRSDDDIAAELAIMQPPAEGIDTVTLMHAGHRASMVG